MGQSPLEADITLTLLGHFPGFEHDCAFRQVKYDQWRRSSGKVQYVMQAAAHMGSCYLIVDPSACAGLRQTEMHDLAVNNQHD